MEFPLDSILNSTTCIQLYLRSSGISILIYECFSLSLHSIYIGKEGSLLTYIYRSLISVWISWYFMSGDNASIHELVDVIVAAQIAKNSEKETDDIAIVYTKNEVFIFDTFEKIFKQLLCFG